MTGQTAAIIILAILLILAITFGGVYAYYSARTGSVSGKVIMANLNIDLVSVDGDGNIITGASGKSEIVISHGTNIVPNQQLENTPLIVKNKSNTSIYLVVVYAIKATKIDSNESETKDDYVKSVIDIGYDYYNPSSLENSDKTLTTDWIDYVFTYQEGENEPVKYRCLVSTVAFKADEGQNQQITVIEANKLKLSAQMGNEYQSTTISFTFQAYAIGEGSFNTDFTPETTKVEKCEKIVNAVYVSQEKNLLNINN